eukprot:CAMPEP_0202898158 /NCGR_PEP_ID=MMETSP1392-20130828/6745_1 /ASSEMBLY_ACC=CAM_ASM_000868 /TAXON_ID=225041 /ORGANISM="Chlamydomonas chlamydogama, Strain SAG 11-48b" /LENGTH=267 /DNA_ID=CAMNT_0049584009 /DNA_START=42 /DNA_END=845 /DNA_ORIENTATION=-
MSLGSLGPRLAGRLTAELILRSRQYMSPLKLYEIDLRGNRISAIENLGATENQFDSIDLSDNAIVKLEGFPRLLRLKHLLLNNNRIARIAKNLEEAIPNLDTLVLTNNRLSNLQELDPLATFPKLTMLSLIGNPVCTKQNYRLYVISKCKKLKILDYKKVKQKEREEAQKMFPTDEAAAQQAAKTFEPEEDLQAAQAQAGVQPAGEAEKAKQGLTPQQVVAIKAAIANASTLEEIQRLESALTTGQLPSEVQIDGNGGEQPEAMEVG